MRAWRAGVVSVVASVLLAAPSASSWARPVGTLRRPLASCTGTWTKQSSANPTTLNSLSGVWASSTTNVWAVGFRGGTSNAPLIEHYDGST